MSPVKNSSPFEFAVLGSGSRGNCTYIRAGETRILVDCGFSGRRTAEFLSQVGATLDNIDAIIFTHGHDDHIGGAGVIQRRHGVPLWASPATREEILRNSPEAPVNLLNPRKPLAIGQLRIQPFGVPHDAEETLGFQFEFGGKGKVRCLVLVTDFGEFTTSIQSHIGPADALICECNHDLSLLRNCSYPWPVKQRILSRHGHISIDHLADGLIATPLPNLRKLILVHLSEEANRPELVHQRFAPFAAERGADFFISRQDGPTPLIDV